MSLVDRRAPRQSVFLRAEISESGGGTTKHRVRDLSALGARVDAAQALSQGFTVHVAVGRLAAVPATVAWVRNEDAGLAFATEIDPEAARATPSAAAPAAAAPGTSPATGRPRPTLSAGWMSQMSNPYRDAG